MLCWLRSKKKKGVCCAPPVGDNPEGGDAQQSSDKKEGCCGIKKNILFLKDNQIRLEKTSKDSDV
jgi:hypothetical protein